MKETVNILLIEDDEDDYLIVKGLLAKAKGLQFAVHWACRLEDGFRALETNTIDVVLLDFTLPDSTGIQTFTRTLEKAPHVPIIALTGLDDETMAVMAVQKGAQDYLVKGGLRTDRLVSSIRYAIERKRTETILNRYRDHLEDLVRKRTATLTEINVKLEGEITERKEMETRLRQAIVRLEEHDRAKTEFVTNVSHELKTPLSSMLYASENLLKGVVGPFPEAAELYIEMINEDCRRLMGTVDDILDLSRAEEKHLVLHRVKLPLAKFVRGTLSSLLIHAEQKKLTLSFDSSNTDFVFVDPLRMERVLLNIVSNSIKFTPPGGVINVEVRQASQPERHAAIVVTDTGIGIPPEFVERVTERYFRIGDHVSGSGLGLSLSQEIIRLHGGTLKIVSPPPQAEQGTQVEVTLPCVAPPLVFVVDDNQETCALLEQQLALHGYEVRPFCSGVEVLRAVEERTPDIMVADLLMPEVSGSELILQIKSQHRWRHLPIVVVTGAELDQSQRETLERFNIPVLTKPWRRDDLLRCLEQALIGKEYVRRQERSLRRGR